MIISALWINHRYRFATWRWFRVCAGLLIVGAVVKLAVAP
jgi:hypothetical protein